MRQPRRHKFGPIRPAMLAALVLLAPIVAFAQTYPKLSRSDLKTLQSSFAVLAEEISPSVVAIRTYKHMRPYSQGSGVIIRANGYVLTNHHVIEDAPEIVVILHDGTEHDAVVMQVDDRSDLAVVKIEAVGLKAARLGDLENVRVGHWTFALGNPFGISNITGASSFTVGNVSSIGRSLTDQLTGYGAVPERYYGNLIETSAAINPGNSGGPLFNIDGEVIGIVSAIETRSGVNEGVGFAIPISKRTRPIIAQLLRGEEVRYGFLGVEIGDAPAGKRHSVGQRRVRGAKVVNVVARTAASRANLKKEDIIIEFDGVAVEDHDHLIRLIGSVQPGTDVDIRLVRGRRQRTVTAVLDDRRIVNGTPESDDGSPLPLMTNWRGAFFVELTPEIREALGYYDVGLVVYDVRRGSDAEKQGLQPDQIVVAVNGENVSTLQKFSELRKRATGPINLLLHNDQTVRFPRG